MKQIEIESEISGKIFRIKKIVGEKVVKGDPILILESMKMEIEVFSPDNGTIKSILVSENQMIEEGEKIAVLITEE